MKLCKHYFGFIWYVHIGLCVKRPGMNVFVAFFVLLILLADNTPPASSTIPLMG